ncbi:MAG TPA: hypothetical protein VFL55_26260 [Acetobacteraceae bacterium]|nr:hypothetical protein [Acetobacteraceae bacterium]
MLDTARTIEAPAIVTIDPKTGWRRRAAAQGHVEAAAGPFGNTTASNLESVETATQPSTKPPQPANDDGPRTSAIVTAKKGPRLRD